MIILDIAVSYAAEKRLKPNRTTIFHGNNTRGIVNVGEITEKFFGLLAKLCRIS